MQCALFSYGFAQVSLRYPSCMGGCRTSSAHASGRDITPNRFNLIHPRSHSEGYGGIAEIASQLRATQGHRPMGCGNKANIPTAGKHVI